MMYKPAIFFLLLLLFQPLPEDFKTIVVKYDDDYEKAYLIRTAITSWNAYFTLYDIPLRIIDYHDTGRTPDTIITFAQVVSAGSSAGQAKCYYDRCYIQIARQYVNYYYDPLVKRWIATIDGFDDGQLYMIVMHELIHSFRIFEHNYECVKYIMRSIVPMNFTPPTKSDINFIRQYV